MTQIIENNALTEIMLQLHKDQKGIPNVLIIIYFFGLLKDLALSLRLLIITARNRFISPFFSVSQSFQGIGRGFVKLLGKYTSTIYIID
jgi:hypothetical protein